MALHLVFETSEARQVEVLRVVNRPIHVAVLVGALVVPDALLAVGFTWDDGRDMDCQELDGSPVQP